ncbi:MAG: hypothetical protein Q8N98_02180 [bacterium]|nr:hypothetical protein [bacterium]
MSPENDGLLGPGDRGRQKAYLGSIQHGPASTQELRGEKIRQAVKLGAGEFAKRLGEAISEEASPPILSVLQQLAGPFALHSLSIRAERSVLLHMSTSVQRAQKMGSDPHVDDQIAEVMVEAILQAQLEGLRRGKSPEDIQRTTATALRAYRDLALLDDANLYQLLSAIQMGVEISMGGLARILGKTGEKMQRVTIDTFDGYPQAFEAIVPFTASLLASVPSFVASAEQARLREPIETLESVKRRAEFLAQTMNTLADEFLLLGETPRANRTIAAILTEGLFANRVHWAGGETVLVLCRKLVENGHKSAAEEFILQAQRSGLLAPQMTGRRQYEAAGLEGKLRVTHGQIISREQAQWGFCVDPIKALRERGGRAIFLFATANPPTIAHRILGAAGFWAVNGLVPFSEETAVPLAFSVNTRKPSEDGRPGACELPSMKERAGLVLQTCAGLQPGVLVASMDLVEGIDPYSSPIAKIDTLLKRPENGGYGIEGIRLCGYDRKTLTHPGLNPVMLGLRGLNLRDLVGNPDLAGQLTKTFSGREVRLLIMTGSTPISSTAVRKDLGSFFVGVDTRPHVRASLHPTVAAKLLKGDEY